MQSVWPKNKVTELFQIEHPIIQGGMVWVSGAKLAAAVSNTGCLGLIGAGSMKPDLLKEHIKKAKMLTSKPFGINLPLFSEYTKEQIEIGLAEGVKIFFTSAGSPKLWTSHLKEKGCLVVQVVSSPAFAFKSQEAGVDAVVLEGFEAGGHNGRDELTTLVLLQQVYGRLDIPVIAAGGIGSGHGIAACFALGAQGVQMGTVFAATQESSAHANFKQAMCAASFSSTYLRMKSLIPVRLLENNFAKEVAKQEALGASQEDLKKLLGKGRAKQGMLEGDLDEGELEIGQIVSQIKEVLTCEKLVERLKREFQEARSLFTY
ncbi:MAG: nitronate monooxygenase [Silvanigrellaceae bacterium]|nr:nitronate monooxygenase [Silvanigrellaceae bacterium]